jgi:hypothetical protein
MIISPLLTFEKYKGFSTPLRGEAFFTNLKVIFLKIGDC